MLNLIGTAVLQILFWMYAVLILHSLENLYSLKWVFVMKNFSDVRGILYEKDEDIMALHTSVQSIVANPIQFCHHLPALKENLQYPK